MKIFCKDFSEINWELTPSWSISNSLNVWLIDVATGSQVIEKLKKTLNEEELKRADRFAFEKDRNQFITAHGTLRTILSKYLETSPAGIQFKKDKWLFGIVGRDITTTFNSWSFNFTEKEKEALYLTNNDIPVKSTELTAPRLIVGVGRNFVLGKKITLLAEANLDLTFDGKRNTLISADPVSADPKIGLECSFNKVFYLRTGINNFQKALSDGDTLNQKKVWIYQPSAGAGFQIQNVRIDYAFTNLANQSNPLFTHVFSLQLNLVNDKNKKKTK